MEKEQNKYELIKLIQNSVIEYDEEKAAELCNNAINQQYNANEIILEGLAKGMDKVGELYEKKEYFVPELLLCSDAMYAGLEVLRPYVKIEDHKATGKIVMGVVEGDIHDIGKTLVKTMFEAAGWEIYDLGKDVKISKFAEEAIRTDANLVALSALMTTSMMAMPRIIEIIKEKAPNVIVMVGGAPLTEDIALEYGADGYAKDAISAVHEAEKLLQIN